MGSNIITPKMFGQQLNLGHWSTDGLVGFYRFIEAGNLVDESFSGNDGVITGATWVGEGLEFGGAGEVNIGTGLNSLPTTFDFTIIVWAKDTILRALGSAAFALNGADDIVLLPYDNFSGGFRVFWRDVGGNLITIAHSLAGTEFHQFVFASYGIADHRAYIDGLQVDAVTDDGSGAGPFTLDAFIGAFNSGVQQFEGGINSVSIYNRALSASEIAALKINPDLPILDDPVWRMFSPAVAAATPGWWGWGWNT